MSTLGIHSDDKYRRSVTISQNVNEPLDHFVMNQTSPKDSVHNSIFLPPANEDCEGYVFTPVCQSFCSQGGHAWLWEGVCVVAGGHAWLWGACMVAGGACVGVGGVYGWGEEGACVVAVGHAWLWGGMHGIQRDTVNERAVRILLECILVQIKFQMKILMNAT